MRIGTRASALALWQARWVQRRLAAADPALGIEIVEVRTTGDRVTDRPLFQIGGAGLFTKELEDRLRDRVIDLAVHSLKDLPTELPPGLEIGAVLERGPALDAGVTVAGRTFAGLPAGARVGTSSLRRRACLAALRPDLVAVDLRGNLDTRLKKLERGDFEAMIAARAGLDRLGVDPGRFAVADLEEFTPAPGQGAVAVEVRSGEADFAPLLAALHHEPTARCVAAERAFLARLGGGCHIPIGAFAREEIGGVLRLVGFAGAVDGAKTLRREGETTGDPGGLGRRLAEEILAAGGREILDLP